MNAQPIRGESLRDVSSGAVGVFTGEVMTSEPPLFCVTWEDGSQGRISERNMMRCVDLVALAAAPVPRSTR